VYRAPDSASASASFSSSSSSSELPLLSLPDGPSSFASLPAGARSSSVWRLLRRGPDALISARGVGMLARRDDLTGRFDIVKDFFKK